MSARMGLALVVAGLVGAGAAGATQSSLHLVYTSEVRGTVGICG